jgi:hypothetical protein
MTLMLVMVMIMMVVVGLAMRGLVVFMVVREGSRSLFLRRNGRNLRRGRIMIVPIIIVMRRVVMRMLIIMIVIIMMI